jgi:protein-tyrosine phosphatase
MMPESLFLVPAPGPGRLATMAAPDGGIHLAPHLAALRSQGFDALVCALTDAEQSKLGLTAEAEVARDAGLEFVHLPIDDFGVPCRSVVPAISQLASRFTGGAALAVHCRAGIGRSGLLAAGILVLAGCDPGSAFQMISDARGRRVPETDEQRAWVYALASPRQSGHSP